MGGRTMKRLLWTTLFASCVGLGSGGAIAAPFFIVVDSAAGVGGGPFDTERYDSRTSSPTGLTANSVTASVTGRSPDITKPDIESAAGSAAVDLSQGVGELLRAAQQRQTTAGAPPAEASSSIL